VLPNLICLGIFLNVTLVRHWGSVQAARPIGGVGYSSTLSWPTALEGGEGSASRPGRSLTSGKTRYPLYGRLGGPQGRSGQVRKISPPPGFHPRTVEPVASRYTDWAIPTHLHRVYSILGSLNLLLLFRWLQLLTVWSCISCSISVVTLYMKCCILVFSASFCATFLSAGTVRSVSMRVSFFGFNYYIWPVCRNFSVYVNLLMPQHCYNFLSIHWLGRVCYNLSVISVPWSYHIE